MYFRNSFKVTLPSDHEIQVVRDFNAPKRLVFEAFTQPELVCRWLLGPPGWTMPVCEIDLRPGGAYRYVWRFEADGQQMGVRGVFDDIDAPDLLVAREGFDEAWFPGESLNTTTFTERQSITTATITIAFQDQAARDTARRSGMEFGMAAGFDRLEQLIVGASEAGETDAT